MPVVPVLSLSPTLTLNLNLNLTRHANYITPAHVHSSHSTTTAIVIQSDLHVLSEAKVDFDADFGKQYGLTKGVLVNDDEGEVFAPVAMWLEAIDLVLGWLKQNGAPLHRIRAVSGACQQHGSVYWNHDAEGLLRGMGERGAAGASLKDLLAGSLSHPYAPNWQDHSTQAQCDEFDAALGDNTRLADVTGSAAHHVSPSLRVQCSAHKPSIPHIHEVCTPGGI